MRIAIHSTQQAPNSDLNNENDVVNAHRPSLKYNTAYLIDYTNKNTNTSYK